MATTQKRGKIWYMIYKNAAGKWAQKAGFKDQAATQSEAQRLEDEAKMIREGNLDPAIATKKIERSKSIAEHIAAYKVKMEAEGLSAGHIAYSIYDLNKLVKFGGLVNASEIDSKLMDRWVASLKVSGDAASCINRRVGVTKAFLSWLLTFGGVSEFKLNRYAKQNEAGKAKRVSRALTAEEVVKLLAAAPAERRDIYKFALLTGFRRSEIASMTPANVDFSNKTIHVKAIDAKKYIIIEANLDEIGRMLGGWIKSTKDR